MHNTNVGPLPIYDSVADFETGYDRDFVERLLGRRNRLSGATRHRLELLEERLTALLAPRLTYCIRGIEGTDGGRVRLDDSTELISPKLAWSLRSATAAICFVATIGAGVDREINALMAEGRLADGYVLDALGSGAIEWVADRFQDQIEREMEREGMLAGPRFSPGYCDWPLTEQRKLFMLIKGRAAGVSLDDSFLMHPRKSVSAIFGLYPATEKPQSRHTVPCTRCAKKDCIARRVEPESKPASA